MHGSTMESKEAIATPRDKGKRNPNRNQWISTRPSNVVDGNVIFKTYRFKDETTNITKGNQNLIN